MALTAYKLEYTDGINNTNNSFSIQPYTVDGTTNPYSYLLYGDSDRVATSAKTSLILFGKGVSDYGEFLQQNLVNLLQNFANASAPVYPNVGQTWYDMTNSTLKIFNGSLWQDVGSSGGGGGTLDSLSDVSISTVATNDYLTYNGITWQNAQLPNKLLQVAAITGNQDDFLAIDSGSITTISPATARSKLSVYSTTQSDSTFLAKTGGTMSGVVNMGNNKITNLATPTASTDAATKGYVDGLGGGGGSDDYIVTGSYNSGSDSITLNRLSGGTVSINGPFVSAGSTAFSFSTNYNYAYTASDTDVASDVAGLQSLDKIIYNNATNNTTIFTYVSTAGPGGPYTFEEMAVQSSITNIGGIGANSGVRFKVPTYKTGTSSVLAYIQNATDVILLPAVTRSQIAISLKPISYGTQYINLNGVKTLASATGLNSSTVYKYSFKDSNGDLSNSQVSGGSSLTYGDLITNMNNTFSDVGTTISLAAGGDRLLFTSGHTITKLSRSMDPNDADLFAGLNATPQKFNNARLANLTTSTMLPAGSYTLTINYTLGITETVTAAHTAIDTYGKLINYINSYLRYSTVKLENNRICFTQRTFNYDLTSSSITGDMMTSLPLYDGVAPTLIKKNTDNPLIEDVEPDTLSNYVYISDAYIDTLISNGDFPVGSKIVITTFGTY